MEKTSDNFVKFIYGKKDLDIDSMEKNEKKEFYLKLQAFSEFKADKLTEDRQRLDYKLLENKIEKLNRRKNIIRLRVGIASAILVLFVIGFNYYQSIERYKLYSSEGFEQTVLKLKDGTKVSLAKHTKLYVSDKFSINNRKVKIDGEAYFEVAHNPKSVFTIVTKKCNVRVLGTKFNLKSYSNKNYFSTSLKEGKVAIDMNEIDSTIVLKPMQKIRYNFNSKKLKLYSFKNNIDLSWDTKKLRFYDSSFEDIVSDLGVYFNKTIIIKDPELKDQKISCVFKNKSLKNILWSMQSIVDYKIRKKDNKILLVKNKKILRTTQY